MIIETIEGTLKYVYTEEAFDLMILSEPIPSKHKGQMLKKMANEKKVEYAGKTFIMADELTFAIQPNSLVTHFGQGDYMLGARKVFLIDATERIDEKTEREIIVPGKNIIDCKDDIAQRYVVFKNTTKAGFKFMRTNITNIKIK